MAIATAPRVTVRYVDKEAMRRILDAQNERLGFVPVPGATARKAREMMLADGVRPEDNILSREILRMRYEEEG